MWKDNILKGCIVAYFCYHRDRKICQILLPSWKSPNMSIYTHFWFLGGVFCLLVGWEAKVPLCLSKLLDENPCTDCLLSVEAHWEAHFRNWLSGRCFIQQGRKWDSPSQDHGGDSCVQCGGRPHTWLWSQSSKHLLSVEGEWVVLGFLSGVRMTLACPT